MSSELEKILDAYRPRLVAMVERRIDPHLSPRIGAEDIVQEAFIVAQRRWTSFRQNDMSSFSWLYRLVRDRLIEAWRKQSSRPRDVRQDMPFPDQSSIQLGLGLVGSGTSPSKAVFRTDLQERMQKTLALLKDSDREILWMRHYDQLSFPEAAQILGIQESAATLRYVRALSRLKKLWHQLYPDEESCA
jgi:RNA polymerase sigma-70 factor (ECF subfamily)